MFFPYWVLRAAYFGIFLLEGFKDQPRNKRGCPRCGGWSVGRQRGQLRFTDVFGAVGGLQTKGPGCPEAMGGPHVLHGDVPQGRHSADAKSDDSSWPSGTLS